MAMLDSISRCSSDRSILRREATLMPEMDWTRLRANCRGTRQVWPQSAQTRW
jgi:hypothetical protein